MEEGGPYWALVTLLLTGPLLVTMRRGGLSLFLAGFKRRRSSPAVAPPADSSEALEAAEAGSGGGQPRPPAPTARAFVVSFGALRRAALGCILFAYLFCLAWAGLFHLPETTATHCHVDNVVPSISAVIGGVAPERHVWRLAVALIVPLRVLDGLLLHALSAAEAHVLPWGALHWSRFAAYANAAENGALFLLTFVSSTESGPVHERGFVFWVLFSLARMAVLTALTAASHRARPSPDRRRVLAARRWLFSSFVALLAAAAYFFVQHNATCRPYLYSAFAACEWLLVLSNIAFNAVAYAEPRCGAGHGLYLAVGEMADPRRPA